MQALTKTRIGNYLRRHLLGDQSLFRKGFKEGVAFAQKYQPAPVQGHDHALEQALTRLQKRYSELEAKVAAQTAAPDLLKALDALLVVQDELCSIDHHGYCQSHYLDNVNSHGGCRVANARALVAKVKGGAA